MHALTYSQRNELAEKGDPVELDSSRILRRHEGVLNEMTPNVETAIINDSYQKMPENAH